MCQGVIFFNKSMRIAINNDLGKPESQCKCWSRSMIPPSPAVSNKHKKTILQKNRGMVQSLFVIGQSTQAVLETIP